jgi:hypothetical protein
VLAHKSPFLFVLHLARASWSNLFPSRLAIEQQRSHAGNRSSRIRIRGPNSNNQLFDTCQLCQTQRLIGSKLSFDTNTILVFCGADDLGSILPDTVKPINYDISIYDLELGGKFSYQGTVSILSAIVKGTKEITLNAHQYVFFPYQDGRVS